MGAKLSLTVSAQYNQLSDLGGKPPTVDRRYNSTLEFTKFVLFWYFSNSSVKFIRILFKYWTFAPN